VLSISTKSVFTTRRTTGLKDTAFLPQVPSPQSWWPGQSVRTNKLRVVECLCASLLVFFSVMLLHSILVAAGYSHKGLLWFETKGIATFFMCFVSASGIVVVSRHLLGKSRFFKAHSQYRKLPFFEDETAFDTSLELSPWTCQDECHPNVAFCNGNPTTTTTTTTASLLERIFTLRRFQHESETDGDKIV
jgi:hypothetical protein